MVLWLYSAEQYQKNTPINEIAEHAARHGFNDEEVDVLCLHGYEFFPPADVARLRERNFLLRDASSLYHAIARRYRNLRGLYPNHFYECFLRWIVLKEFYAGAPILAWDADIFFNEKLSRIHAEFAGSTMTCSSTCFAALHDPGWLAAYEQQLNAFERGPDAYLAAAYTKLAERKRSDPRQFDHCFFGGLTLAALESREAWHKLFASTPEEMFVDFLVREGVLPHHQARARCEYLLCPQPLLLPQLAWVHPMGAGLPTECASPAPAAGFEYLNGRYLFNGRPLAFLHFQGALFRVCALHQIHSRFLEEPVAIHDEFYCPPERRRGRSTAEFYRRQSLEIRLASLRHLSELKQRWGDPFSERDVARNFLLQSNLTEVIANSCMNSPCLPPPTGQTTNELSALVAQMAHFFLSESLLQIDWPTAHSVAVMQRGPDGTVADAQVCQVDDDFPRLPLADGGCDTVFNLGSLNLVPEAALAGWLIELHRLTGRNVWIALDALPGRSQVWWERKFFEVGFRKHPLMSLVVPYPASERDESRVMLVLEKIPAAALAQYPLSALKAERDLHMDMLREAGVRSEAHLARYQLAARHARDGGVILDAACGLGYGSAMLARQFPHARVIGVDISEYAINYARANFAGVLPNLEFHLADACNLSMIPEGTVDLVISFETIEHVPDPGLFLRGAVQRMKAGATFIGSIPNLWLDETGKDPNPWHFHVFDLPKFYQLMAGFLHVSHVYRENAGGHLRNTSSRPDLRAVQLPVTDQLEEAEWWIIAARKIPASLSATGTKPRIWLIDGENRGRFYVQLQESFEAEWLIGSSLQPENLDLAIVSDEWWGPSSVQVQRLKRLGVPTLHVVDGVVDWKNTWENPRSLSAAAGLPLFQPVLSDKIACLGQAQARVLGTWGNAAKCEIVGAPRFDRYYALKRRKRTAEMPALILIITANTPYFNEQQHADILEGLKDLKEFFALAAQEGIPIEPVWRLTKGLDAELGLTPAATAARELADVLVAVDAVIGSSSTALLEAMLLGLPTALLDYSNCPHYLQPAWQITAARQIPLVVGELVNPPLTKMLEQETVLHDNLECASPATARLIQLVTVMIEEGCRARRCGEMPSFRPQMLSPGTPVQILPENRFSLAKLYADHPVFRIDSIAELQAELNHWRKIHSESIWKSYALLTVQWRSKLEAATILSGLGQSEAAVDLMMQSLNAVESCNQPEVVLEAVLEVSTHLARHDAGLTRRLLAMALNLARRLGRSDAIQRATQILEALSPLDSKMVS